MNELTNFLNKFIAAAKETGFDVSDYPMDHAAYQASSSQDYDNQKTRFEELGELFGENIIGGRRVAVYRLYEPFEFEYHLLTALEIIEPKEGQVCESGWEHAEFVVDKPFDEIMGLYPDVDWNTKSASRKNFQHLKIRLSENMQLKLHHKDILQTIIDERKSAQT